MEKVGDLTNPGQVIPGTSGKHPITAAIGTAITGGKENAGTKGYLMVCFLYPINPNRRQTDPNLALQA